MRPPIRFGRSLQLAVAAVTGDTVLTNLAHPLNTKYETSQLASELGYGLLELGRWESAMQYLATNWNALDRSLRPPYKIFVDGKGWTEITDADLRAWANQSGVESDDSS
jgi:hypothetical protein